MQDTSHQTFVLFSCDMWSITAEFRCATPRALASELAAHNTQLDFPNLASWDAVASQAFDGFPAFILSGKHNGGYLLLSGETVPFWHFDKAEGVFVTGNRSYWTLADHDEAVTSFDSRH